MNNWHTAEAFQSRLKKIGIEVELAMNFPWIYLKSVNGKEVKEKFNAEHGFTAFWAPLKDKPARVTDRKKVFEKVREMINE